MSSSQDMQYSASQDSALPVIGGDTAVTLTSAATLQSLGVSVTALGSATLDTSGATPVADFPITGGTEGPGSGNDVLLHQGSGLELSDNTGTIDINDLRIDTQTGMVDANVTADGQSDGNLAVFDLGSDGATLTLTAAAAAAVDQTLGTMAITTSTIIGTAAPSPVALPFAPGHGLLAVLRFLSAHEGTPPATSTQPVVGGDTAVTLTSAATLQSLGVSVTALGSASLNTSGSDPVAYFPITGGTEGPGSGTDVFLHQGSGLELSDSTGTIELNNFLIDTQNGVVDADVTANGQSDGNLAVFNLGSDGATLTLTAAAAGVVDQVLGTTAITSSTVIGTAAPSPVALPGGLASLLTSLGEGGWHLPWHV